MRLFFMWSDIGNKTAIGSLTTRWYGGPWYEVNGVGVALAVILDALDEASKLPRIGRAPGLSVGSMEDLMELLFNACVWVGYGVGFGEEVGSVGGLSIGDAGYSHSYFKEGVSLVLN